MRDPQNSSYGLIKKCASLFLLCKNNLNLRSLSLLLWDFFCFPPLTSMCIRHLQILSGMERLEYVIVYWILITKIEAILKKKVPKIATGSFKKLWKNKILGKKSIGPWLGFEPTVPSLVGQFWSVALTTTPQRHNYRLMSQTYYLSSLVPPPPPPPPPPPIQISKCFTFLWSVSNTLQHTCPAPYRPKFEGV